MQASQDPPTRPPEPDPPPEPTGPPEEAPPGASEAWIRGLGPSAAPDRPEWGTLFRRYHRRLLALAGRRLGPHLRRHVDPEDLVNEAWARVWRNWSHFEYRGPESLYRWLCELVMRAAVDHARRHERKTSREEPAGEEPLEPPAPAPGPRTEATRADSWRRLVETLEAVREPYRRVLELCFLEGLSTEEAAARLGAKPDTVRKQRNRGLEVWRGLLGEDPLGHL